MDSKPSAHGPAQADRAPRNRSRTARRIVRSLFALAGLATLALAASALPHELLAQAAQNTPGPPREMRQFWHVFIAYAIAWLLVFVWILTILRRIRRVDDRLTKLEGGK